MKKVTAIIVAAVLTFGLVACGSGNEEAQKPETTETETVETEEKEAEEAEPEEETVEEEKKVIAVLPMSMAQEFGADVVSAVEKACDSYGYECIVLDPDLDLSTQISMMEDLVVQKVDGCIFAAIDTTSMGAIVEELKSAGIKVVDYDSTVDEGNTDASIKSDDYQGGYQAAEILMEKINDPKATIIVYGTSSTIGTGYLRNSGFHAYMEENYPDVTIVETRPSEGAGTRDGCRTWAVDMLTAYPEAKGFFTFYGDGAIGTYFGVKDKGREDIIIVGYDASAEQQEIMISDGSDCILQASMAQYPKLMGRMAVETMNELFEGTYTKESAEDIIYIEPGVLKAEDAENYEEKE